MIVRDDSEASTTAYTFLEEFCSGKIEFMCGIANRTDDEYDGFNDWVNDPENNNSRLIYINAENFEKYLYEGDLANLNENDLTEWMKEVKEGKVNVHQPKNTDLNPESATEEAQNEEATETEAPEGTQGDETTETVAPEEAAPEQATEEL